MLVGAVIATVTVSDVMGLSWPADAAARRNLTRAPSTRVSKHPYDQSLKHCGQRGWTQVREAARPVNFTNKLQKPAVSHLLAAPRI